MREAELDEKDRGTARYKESQKTRSQQATTLRGVGGPQDLGKNITSNASASGALQSLRGGRGAGEREERLGERRKKGGKQ